MSRYMQNVGAMVVSIIVTAGFVGLCFLMIFMPPPDTTIGNVMFNCFSSGFTLVLGYWLGSSSGSKAKDGHIETLINGTSPSMQPAIALTQASAPESR